MLEVKILLRRCRPHRCTGPRDSGVRGTIIAQTNVKDMFVNARLSVLQSRRGKEKPIIKR